MPKKRFSAEQIVTLLRQIEVSMAQGKPTPVWGSPSRSSRSTAAIYSMAFSLIRHDLYMGEIFDRFGSQIEKTFGPHSFNDICQKRPFK